MSRGCRQDRPDVSEDGSSRNTRWVLSAMKKGHQRCPRMIRRSELCCRCGFRCDTAVRQFFLDTRRLARTFAQVVQLGAAHIAATLDFDRCDQRGIQLKGTLDAFARRHLANDEV